VKNQQQTPTKRHMPLKSKAHQFRSHHQTLEHIHPTIHLTLRAQVPGPYPPPPKRHHKAHKSSFVLSRNDPPIRARSLNSGRNRGKRNLTLMASMAYSTWNRRPSGEKVFTPRSYSVLRQPKTHREISPSTTTTDAPP
jgi:hypothetical protein